MKKKDLCQSLIKIANQLDESGYHKEANKLTLTVDSLTKSAAFLGDLGNNLLGEAKSYLDKQNPTILNPATGSFQPNTNAADNQSNANVLAELVKQQKELFTNMKTEFTPKGSTFENKYPELSGLTTMDQVYRKAYNLSIYNNPNRNKYKDFVAKIYTKYYMPDVDLRYKIRQLG